MSNTVYVRVHGMIEIHGTIRSFNGIMEDANEQWNYADAAIQYSL